MLKTKEEVKVYERRIYAKTVDYAWHYSMQQFSKDVVAGVIVAIIALPLSIALALASGVGPRGRIYTAIVGGL